MGVGFVAMKENEITAIGREIPRRAFFRAMCLQETPVTSCFLWETIKARVAFMLPGRVTASVFRRRVLHS